MRCTEITKAQKKLEAAKASFSDSVARTQDKCPHPTVLERPSGSTGYQYIENRYVPAVRVCARCGYVEEARYGWPARTTDTPLYNTKPNSKSVLNRVDFQIDQDRLYAEIVSRS